jgi:hypothetical protein
MLLHVIATSNGIDAAMDWPRPDAAFDNMNNGASLIFNAIDQWHIVDQTQIIWLTAGGWIERGLVQHSAQAAAYTARFDDVCIEFQKIGIVVIKPFGLHANSPSRAEVERDERKAGAQPRYFHRDRFERYGRRAVRSSRL